jgi:hypothetical protein
MGCKSVRTLTRKSTTCTPHLVPPTNSLRVSRVLPPRCLGTAALTSMRRLLMMWSRCCGIHANMGDAGALSTGAALVFLLALGSSALSALVSGARLCCHRAAVLP